MPQPLVVTPAEAGQKLLQFLVRRFDLPHGVLHRWIRTGQVRINGGRVKAFDRVEEGDEIRIPPFAEQNRQPAISAEKDSLSTISQAQAAQKISGQTSSQHTRSKSLPRIVAETEELLVFCKPSGLPVHPGSGHTDSLTTRIEAGYAGADFMPAPVHRLDRDTSGLLLVAKTYRMARKLSDALASHDGHVVKEYLAWVAGNCPWTKPIRLSDRLAKQAQNGRERMAIQTSTPEKAHSGKEQQASLTVCCIAQLPGASLVLVRLHTGRTHQIRAQLSGRGFPLLGDVKYGGPPLSDGLKLHAARLVLDGTVYEVLPEWKGKFHVAAMPPVNLLDNPLPESAAERQNFKKNTMDCHSRDREHSPHPKCHLPAHDRKPISRHRMPYSGKEKTR